MQIPTYQIHNVLKQHIDQLTGKSKRIDAESGFRFAQGAEGRFFAAKRREVVRTVTKQILERAVNLDPEARGSQTAGNPSEGRSPAALTTADAGETTFVFNVVDEEDCKVSKKISVQKPSFVLKGFAKKVSESS